MLLNYRIRNVSDRFRLVVSTLLLVMSGHVVAEVPESEGYPILINNSDTYSGQWKLESDEHYTSGLVTRVLPVGRHVLIFGQYARFHFDVVGSGDGTEGGSTHVEDAYRNSLIDGHLDLDFQPKQIDLITGEYAGDWTIHRVATHGDRTDLFLMYHDATNSDGTVGASYRMSFADAGSAIRFEVSTNALTVSPGNNAGVGGIKVVGDHEIHIDTRRILVREVTETGDSWRFQGHTDNFGDAHIALIPEVPFYFIDPTGQRTEVNVSVDCDVSPYRIFTDVAEFQLTCDDPDHPALPKSVIVSSSIGDFEITTIEGTFDDLQMVLRHQAWYTDSDQMNDYALEFSSLLGDQLGRPNFYLEESKPPAFAYAIRSGGYGTVVFAQADDSYDPRPNESSTWAIGVPVTTQTVPKSPTDLATD